MDLLGTVLLKPGDMITLTKQRLDEQAVLDYYLERGYPDVQVTSRVDEDATTSGTEYVVVFEIDEGIQVTVREIQFSGNSFASASTLRGQMNTKAQSIFNTGVFQAREGYVLPFSESVRRPIESWTTIYPAGEKFGDNRLPTFWMLSLGLEKTFKISDTANVTLFVDGYNVTNNNTTLLVETDLTADNFNEPLRILNPGIFQFGVRVNF